MASVTSFPLEPLVIACVRKVIEGRTPPGKICILCQPIFLLHRQGLAYLRIKSISLRRLSEHSSMTYQKCKDLLAVALKSRFRHCDHLVHAHACLWLECPGECFKVALHVLLCSGISTTSEHLQIRRDLQDPRPQSFLRSPPDQKHPSSPRAFCGSPSDEQ